jgi:hypothetical protein
MKVYIYPIETFEKEETELLINWWTEMFLIENKKEDFRNALTEKLKEGVPYSIYVDYDPDEFLLEVIRGIGVECSGQMFSADGIFRWSKTGCLVREDEGVPYIVIKAGYRGRYERITEVLGG